VAHLGLVVCHRRGAPDPGDGSIVGTGCPHSFELDDAPIPTEATVGFIDGIDASWDEGGLCCKPLQGAET